MPSKFVALCSKSIDWCSTYVKFDYHFGGRFENLWLITVTSRPMGEYEVDGEACRFVTQERMQQGIDENEFIDVGEHDTYLYGTTFNSVRAVMKESKLCVLDCRPEVANKYCIF